MKLLLGAQVRGECFYIKETLSLALEVEIALKSRLGCAL